jgi:threonine dehydratase
VTGSAGNHAQAVAYAARARGVHCEVFMPEGAAIAKVEAATALDATVHLVGANVDDSLGAAHERAREGGLAFVHPFDDPDVIAGQGGVGLELLDQVPDITRVIVPVGGGGLISGMAIALKAERPSIEVIGVRVVDTRLTIADGIAVKQPGELTRPLIERWVDQLVTVSEDEIAEAMVFLLERAKLVVEGAGAVGAAALLGGRLTGGSAGTTVAVLSGGNVDAGLLANIARHHESHAGRRLVLLARVPDRPGSLARLLALVGDLGANLLDVQHNREGIDLHNRETAVQLVLETRGPGHAGQVVEAIRDAGYGEPPRLPTS